MNAGPLNFAEPATEESACPDEGDFGDNALNAIQQDVEAPRADRPTDDDWAGEWPVHPRFDADEMAKSVLEMSVEPTPRRRGDRDSSQWILAVASSVAVHLSVAAICLVLAAKFVSSPARQTDQRLGGATSEGGYVDSSPSPSNDPADLPKAQVQPAVSADRPIEVNETPPNGAFPKAAAQPPLPVAVIPTDPPPLIGPPSEPMAVPAFAKPISPVIAENPPTANAVASTSSAPSSHLTSNAALVAAPPAHFYGQARVKGTPGGRRDGYDLDDRGIPIPDYPLESKRRREEGTVKLDLEILANGSVGQIAILDDAGYPRLATASVTSARAAHFEPGTCDGQPVACHLIVPYRFTLR